MTQRKQPRELDPYGGLPAEDDPSPEQIMAEAETQARFIASTTGEDYDAVWARFKKTAERLIAEYHP